MRLIDADNINFHCNYDGDCTGDIDDCKECGNYICDFRDIQEQPTAYDIDKVVKELETNKQNALEVEESIKEYNVWNKAIEIIKQSGVSDDVCEWKMDNVGASIGCRSDLHHTGYVNETYCPFCKKKIKVVE